MAFFQNGTLFQKYKRLEKDCVAALLDKSMGLTNGETAY